MQNTIPCPSCRRELRVPDQLIGKLVKCPACATTFTASFSEPSPPIEAELAQEDSREPPVEDVPEEPGEEDYEPRPLRSRRRRRFYVEHRGALVLTLGILSLVVCNPLGPVAWIMGNNDLAAMRAGRMDPSGQGITQAGQICGIIGTIFLILGCALTCLWFVGAGLIAGAGAGKKF
jgi:predicted Zn finger-like uncharacterized protein